MKDRRVDEHRIEIEELGARNCRIIECRVEESRIKKSMNREKSTLEHR